MVDGRETGTGIFCKGTRLAVGQAPVVVDGHVLVPLRAVFESLGATVGWQEADQSIRVTAGENGIWMQYGNPVLGKNGVDTVMDVPPQMVNGYAMVQLEAVAVAMDVAVEWLPELDAVMVG